MSDQKYENSCILYPLPKPGVNGTVTIDGVKWYATMVPTGFDKPSHQLFLRNANGVDFTGAGLFKNGPDKKSVISGSIQMHKEYWIDVYVNKSKDDRPDFLTLKFTEKQPKPQQQEMQYQQEQSPPTMNTGVDAFL